MTHATRASRPSIGLVIITIISLLISLGGFARPALATHVSPDPKPDNPTCGQFGKYDYEFRINAPGDGTFNDASSDFEVTLTFHNTAAGQTMDFVANLPVDAVFIKGGPNGNLYTYDPPGPAVTSDTGLHAQVNPSNGTYYGVSHVSFCFDELPLVPALEIEKTPDGSTVNAGDPISFSISVTNTGDADALNVDIDDALDSRFAWTDDRAECSIDSNANLHCDIGTLAPDATFIVTVSAPTDGTVCGSIQNVASADADGISQINDSGAVAIACADIEIEKTPDGGSVEIGNAITFALTVSNIGTGEARGVVVTDSLPGTGWSIVIGETTLTGCALTGSSLSCAPQTIAAGGNAKVTVTKTATYDADCGRIDNTAQVTTSNDGMDSDAGHLTVLCADIEVDKTPDDGQVTAGDSATFTIVTSNQGGATAHGVELTDELPITEHGWSIVDASTDWAGCQISDLPGEQQSLACGPESIAASGSLTVAVTTTTTADDCGALPNLVEVQTLNNGSDEDAGQVTVLCPELAITKTTHTPEVSAGDPVEYTITVINTGDGAAKDVVITDELPDGIAWAATSDECSIDGDGTLTCGPLSIGADSSFSVTVTGTTDAGECPSIENSASFTSSYAGSGSTEETPTEIVVNCPDLQVTKQGSSVVVAGDAVSYTISVTNHGDGDAHDVELTDQLPALGSGTWAITDVSGVSVDACAIESGVLTCTVALLEADDSFSVTVGATTDPDDCPSLDNTASVSASNEPTDETTQEDNEDSHTITVNCPDASIEKEATTPIVNAGDDAVFTITVTAGGTGTNENVTVSDPLSGSAADWSWDVSGAGDGEDCAIDENALLVCAFGDLEPGQSVTIVLTYETSADDCPSIGNEASVSATDDVDRTNNTSDEVTITVDCPDVTVDKEAVESPISAGEQGRFTLQVTNLGPGTAYDVEVNDTAPEGTEWTILDDGGFDCADEVVGDQQTITCTLDELGDGESATILIGYETSQEDCGRLDNAVDVTAGNEPRENTENNSDEASIFVECPGLNVDKQADADSIDAGEVASFTITVWNSGPGTALDVELHDELPAGLAWDFKILEGDADCDVASSKVNGGTEQMSIDCDLGDLEEDEQVVIRVFAETDRDDCGELENTAFADASNDDEDSESDEMTVTCPTATLVIDKAANTETITISGEADDLVATPSVVTWTLTYTLTDGPVSNAVITDEIPDGFVFLDASGGGTFADGTVTWSFATLSESGSVTFRTTVDPETISRVAPTVNVAVIDSDQTEPDEGEDDVRVTVEPPPLGGNPTPKPKPSLPDTATGIGIGGEPVSVPVELMAAFFIGSLGVLALANAKARNRRR